MSLKVLSFAFLSSLVVAYEPTLYCSTTHRFPTECILENVLLTTETLSYKIAPNGPSVKNVEILDSRLAVISSDFCRTFPRLGMFLAAQQGVEVLAVDAFSSCPELWFVDLKDNSIKLLPPRVFQGSGQLSSLDLAGNQIQRISTELFKTNPNLEFLYLERNRIRQLKAETFESTRLLRILLVASNDLVDYEAEGFVKVLPELNITSFNGNLIPCARMQPIVRVLRKANVDFRFRVPEPRKRIYTMAWKEDLECVLGRDAF